MLHVLKSGDPGANAGAFVEHAAIPPRAPVAFLTGVFHSTRTTGITPNPKVRKSGAVAKATHSPRNEGGNRRLNETFYVGSYGFSSVSLI